jgi:hypothetical protein
MSDYARDHGSKLFIYYLKETDSGWYECSTANGHSNRIHLTVRESNEIAQDHSLNDQRHANKNEEIQQDHYSFHDQQENQHKDKQVTTFIEKNEDENVEIECPLSEVNDIKWRKLDGVIKNS